jgi:hypothetical protein
MCLMSGKRDFVCRSGVNAARGWITLSLFEQERGERWPGPEER